MSDYPMLISNKLHSFRNFAVTNEQVNNPNHKNNENNALDDVHPTGSNTCFNSMC